MKNFKKKGRHRKYLEDKINKFEANSKTKICETYTSAQMNSRRVTNLKLT
jgi:hypothetical protein